MQLAPVEAQALTAEEIISWAMSRETAESRSRSFVEAKLAQLAFTGDVDDLELDT